MAKFIVEAKSAKDLHRGGFEVIEPYKDRCFEDAIRDQEALEMQEMCQNKIQQLEKKIAILANTIEENELMDYHLSKAFLEDEKKLKRKISDLKKERSELKQRMVNQDNRNRDLHRDLDSLESDKILLGAKLNVAIDQSNYISQLENDLKELNIKDGESVGAIQGLKEENRQLRNIVSQYEMIDKGFEICTNYKYEDSILSDGVQLSDGWTSEPRELKNLDWVNLIILKEGESIRCTKDQFMGVEIGDILTVKKYSDGYYTFSVNKKEVIISEKSITDDCFERVIKDTLGWYVSEGYVIGLYRESKLMELLSKGETIYGNIKDAYYQVTKTVTSK